MALSSVEVVRVEERLKIKIGEAKNLPSRRHGSVGLRDTYCSISLDQEEIFRTSTAEKSLSPLYCQEFQFEVPRQFRYLSVYVYDRDRTSNKLLGKVSIKRDDLNKYHNKDHWFPISHVDADSEVQGKVHVEVKLDQYIKASSSGSYSHRLLVKVKECNGLAVISGSCDPYAVVSLSHNGKIDTKHTKVRKKTVCPQFEESFCFELPMKADCQNKSLSKVVQEDVAGAELRISMMHDSSGVFGSNFLGEVKIPLESVELIRGHSAWYLLQPRESLKKQKPDLGSLRLKISYTADHVLSSQFYEPLKELLLKSPSVVPISSSCAYILGEVVANKIDVAQPLVKMFLHHKNIVSLIKALAEREISKITDPNTIFRGNTLVSKCMDEFMKLAGMHYLHQTLKRCVEMILTERKPCEIDPTKLPEGEYLQTNMINLKCYIESVFRAITNSPLSCPPIMCEVFSTLKQLAIHYFPNDEEVSYCVISGFIFLRFFAPAILGPKLFELSSQQVDGQVNRTLTLISKTIQSLGNLVSSRSPNQIFKEDYMVSLYKDFFTEPYIKSVRVFLELISSGPSDIHACVIAPPVILKEGVMIKRAQGRKRFGVKNFKKRYFCLTTQELFYAKSSSSEPLCNISVDHILAVERLEENCFKMKNMFQVIQPDRALYIQANNCVEEKEWIDILTKVCQSNRNRLKEYHPAAFINNHWLCCKSQNELASGCAPVTACVPADIRVQVDSDRELERIYTIFVNHIDQLQKLKEACEHQAVYTGESYECNFLIEDSPTMWETLAAISQCVSHLQKHHKQYLRNLCRRTKYGSVQAPIGDDNFLMLLAETRN